MGGRRRREKEGWADEVQTGERRTKKIIDRARRKLDADQRECRKKRVLTRDKLWDLDQSPILEMRHLGLPAYSSVFTNWDALEVMSHDYVYAWASLSSCQHGPSEERKRERKRERETASAGKR